MAKKRKFPIVVPQKLHAIGSSYAIIIPKKWFTVHNLDPKELNELLLVLDKDIRIVNPEHEAEVYEEVSRLAKEAKI